MVGEGGRFVVGIVSSSMGVFSGCSSVDGLCVKGRIKKNKGEASGSTVEGGVGTFSGLTWIPLGCSSPVVGSEEEELPRTYSTLLVK